MDHISGLDLTIGDAEGHAYSLKSESAAKTATGANEVIRQFNKVRGSFFDGSSHDVPKISMVFELAFTPSEYNIRHIGENAEMYNSVVHDDTADVRSDKVRSQITVRDVDDITPIVFFSENTDFREGIGGTSFVEYVEYTQPSIFSRFEDAFRDIA